MSVSNELQQFAEEIQSFLSPNTLRDLARDVGFVQRTSKYQAKDLVVKLSADFTWLHTLFNYHLLMHAGY
ncbi:hypothetical protein COJ84_29540 [Bacillus thuringiensis]|uniref:hypothetical protein n=1 Tax=Bacillus thuringiensis TaxID=1428 RepID=UPI000BF97465|nr:hypothetical protein [Bacillus thuringiensis]PFO31321.1 hypothetical protein COJ84_29540 [Bacillus thuringiensis]